MITYEIEFHKVSSLPTNNENYRGHVFFNDATNEPIETIIDKEGNEVQKRRYERGIYLCAYDGTGRLSYIPYTVAGAGGDDVGMDIDTLNDRITLWASKFQNDIQNLAKLTVDPSQITAQVRKFYNELNGEIADLRIKSDQIKADVAKDINGVRQQYSQFTQTANDITTYVNNLNTNWSQVEQTANGIVSKVKNLETDLSQVEQTATAFRTTVNDNINNLETRISQTAAGIRSEVENKINNVKTQIEQLPNQIKMDVSDELDSASIIARINDGDSEVKIHADKIVLDGAAIADSLRLGGQATTDLFNQYKNTITDDLQASIDDLRTRVDDTIDNWYYDHYPVDWSDASRAYASNSISYNTEHNISQNAIEEALGQSTTPKVDAEPYASWVKDGKDDRSAHIGDTFTNTKFSGQSDVRDGRTWKFCATANSDGSYTDYRWEPMSDSASAAMRAITDLENAVSNKRQVFVDTPTPPYEKGDLWVITESTDGNTSGKNIYVCITPKGVGAAFSNTDWISTNNFVGEDVFNTKIDEAKNVLVNKINDEVAKVDLREVLAHGGEIELENGSRVPVSGMISNATDANGVKTLTMRVNGEEVTWQIIPGVDANGNECLVVGKPWGDPDDPASSSFVVDSNGLLEAHNAVIYGKIVAGSGEIGGIGIFEDNIKSSNDNFKITSNGELTAKNANIEGTIKATSLIIGDGVEIPQGKVHGLGDTIGSIQTVANTAAATATNALSTATNAATTATNMIDNYNNLQRDLTNLQSEVADYLRTGSTTSDMINNAFSQTVSRGGLMLSGNIFVADSEGYITAGMMGATATDASKTPRFFAGNPTNSISSSNTNLGPDSIYGDTNTPNYPFMVTADGRLYATNAELTGSLKITRTITNNEGKSEVKLYDIGDYVIGKIDEETGKLDTRGTVSGAIDTVTTAVYGPAMTKEQLAAVDKIKNGTDDVTENDKSLIKTYNQGIMASNYLIGRILRAEGKIAALQNDINVLLNGVSDGSYAKNKVAYICSNCGGKFIEDVPMDGGSPAKSKPCPTCGMNTYMGLVAKGGIGNNGSIGGGAGDSTGDSSNIIDVPISRPWLPITSKDTVENMRPLES